MTNRIKWLATFAAVAILASIGSYAPASTAINGDRTVHDLTVTGTCSGCSSGGGVSSGTGGNLGYYATSGTQISDSAIVATNVALKTGEQAGGYRYCADAAGSGTTYTCTLTPTLLAYTTGMLVTFKPGTANTAAATLNIDGLGAKAVDWTDGTTALTADDLLSGGIYQLEYDGTVFRKINGPDGAWTTVSFNNSWVDSGLGAPWHTGMYRKDRLGNVCLRGLIKGGTTTGGTVVLTLPAGYRPAYQDYFLIMNSAATTTRRFDLATNGTLTYQTGGTLDFADLAQIGCFSTLP